MNLNRALSLLGLSIYYTSVELEKAYRIAIIKYHPDLYKGKEKYYAEKKTEEINSARDYLEDILESHSKEESSQNSSKFQNESYSQQPEDILPLKWEKICRLNEKSDELCDIQKGNDSLLNEYIKKIDNLITDAVIHISFAFTRTEIYSYDSEVNKKIGNLVSEFIIKYIKNRGLKPESLDFLNIDLSSLKEVYKYLQLKLVEEIKRILELEASKFEYYSGFAKAEASNLLTEYVKEEIMKKVLKKTISLNEVEKEFEYLVFKSFEFGEDFEKESSSIDNKKKKR